MKVVYYVPDITNPFWGEVASGIKDRAKADGITLEVVSASSACQAPITTASQGR